MVYIDDISIYNNNEEEYIEVVRRVLQTLTKNNLCVNIDKCLFYVPEVEFPGFHVRTKEIQMNKQKVEDILN